jgi:hypothetical protein
MGEEKTPLTQ